MKVTSVLGAAFGLYSVAAASGFPPQPENVTVIDIPTVPGASISYKETYICETLARGWAGYVHMPASYLKDIQGSDPYNVSMFFWYFQARHHPHKAPTSMYFAGGPGESSMYGVGLDGGPCIVQPDSNSTETNPWSWNENINMLYVDQPVGAGFSYDSLHNSTLDLLFPGATDLTDTGIAPFSAYDGEVPAANETFLYGTLPSQNLNNTANTSTIAARTLWHFAQIWFTDFPEYHTSDVRISLWGNSYGGFWTTTIGAYIVSQNEKIQDGKIAGHILPLHSIGITNGCVDELYQTPYYPELAYNNTYGLEVIPKDVYEESMNNFTKPGGCRDLVEQCRALGDQLDPDQVGNNSEVNALCMEASSYCTYYVIGAYDVLSNRSDFDMGHYKPDPLPPYYVSGYMNQHWVQRALGVPVNFTYDSNSVTNNFAYITGDFFRTPGMKYIEALLDAGVGVHLVYGDRDYRCPWNGMEAVSLQANWSGADAFRSAGYTPIRTNTSYDGGVVRQYGNLSFSRVFDAGHDTAYFQPETVFQIVTRSMFGRDIATGRHSGAGGYKTQGPLSSWEWKNELPVPPEPICNLWAVGVSCTVEQYEALLNGTAVVQDYTVVSPSGFGEAL